MANQPRKNLMTRSTYKEVKKYNHIQFEAFVESIYKSGYEDGRASVPGVDLNKIMGQIRGVKGIGAKRMEQIEQSIGVLFQEVQDGGKGV